MKALVNAGIAALHREKQFLSPAEDEVLYGMPADILSDDGDWVRIDAPYHYEGYISKSQLILDQELADEWVLLSERLKLGSDTGSYPRIACVWHSYADVLSEPRVQGICMMSIPRGGRVMVTAPADENGWVMVQLVCGRHGYMKEGFLGTFIQTPDTDEAHLRHAVTETAKLYLGTQYRWGGKTPLGIDCSGLVSMAYLLNGVSIYRDAAIKEGFPVKEIAFDKKKAGDLLFCPGHVAMYLGDGRYIHSTAKNGSDGVVYNSLNPEASDYRADLAEKFQTAGSIFV